VYLTPYQTLSNSLPRSLPSHSPSTLRPPLSAFHFPLSFVLYLLSLRHTRPLPNELLPLHLFFSLRLTVSRQKMQKIDRDTQRYTSASLILLKGLASSPRKSQPLLYPNRIGFTAA